MYYVMDAHSFFSFIYFILLIVIGSFFMINLCLVVIATQFSETKQREQRLMEEARLKFMSNDSTLASYQARFQNSNFIHLRKLQHLSKWTSLNFFLKMKKATWFNVYWINPIGGILLEKISEKNKCVSKIPVKYMLHPKIVFVLTAGFFKDHFNNRLSLVFKNVLNQDCRIYYR